MRSFFQITTQIILVVSIFIVNYKFLCRSAWGCCFILNYLVKPLNDEIKRFSFTISPLIQVRYNGTKVKLCWRTEYFGGFRDLSPILTYIVGAFMTEVKDKDTLCIQKQSPLRYVEHVRESRRESRGSLDDIPNDYGILLS